MKESAEFVLQNNLLFMLILMIAYLILGTIFNAATNMRHYVAVDRIGYILILVTIILAPELGLPLATIVFMYNMLMVDTSAIEDYPKLSLWQRLGMSVTITFKEIFR